MPLDELAINQRWNEMLRRQGVRRAEKKQGTRYAAMLQTSEAVIDAGLLELLQVAQQTYCGMAAGELRITDANTVMAFFYDERAPARL